MNTTSSQKNIFTKPSFLKLYRIRITFIVLCFYFSPFFQSYLNISSIQSTSAIHPSDDQANRGLFASKVALQIDILSTKYPESPFLSTLSATAARIMSLCVFPVAATIDLVNISLHTGKTVITHGATSEEVTFNLKKLSRLASSILATPFSIINPSLTTRYFIPAVSHGTFQPYGRFFYHGGELFLPKSIEELQLFLRENPNQKISIIGAGMSQAALAVPSQSTAIGVSLSNFKSISIDKTTMVATVGAGVTWEELQKEASNYGLAPLVSQASPIFSIGGSIGINCHGWDHRHGTLANTIKKLWVLTAKGELLDIDPQHALFPFIVGGWGLSGIVVKASLQMTPNIPLKSVSEDCSLVSYVERFRAMQQDPKSHMHRYRLNITPGSALQKGFITSYIVNETGYEPLTTIPFENERGTPFDRIAVNAARYLPILRSFGWNFEHHRRLKETTLALRSDHMHPSIKMALDNAPSSTEILQEYFLPPDQIIPFTNFLSEVLIREKVTLLNASIRYVSKDSSTLMSYAPEERFSLVLFFTQKTDPISWSKSQCWIREVLDKVLELKGSFYVPYPHFASLDQFQKSYPQWQEYLKAKAYLDPNERFSTKFYKEYFLNSASNFSHYSNEKIIPPITLPSNYQESIEKFSQVIFPQLDPHKANQFILKHFRPLKAPEIPSVKETAYLYQLAINPDSDLKASSGIDQIKISLNGLHNLKRDLQIQAKELLSNHSFPKQETTRYLEIGYPGRLVPEMKELFHFDQTLIAHSPLTLSDRLQWGGIGTSMLKAPYDQHIIWDGKSALSKEIPDASLDLVSMFIGLHHLPEESLEDFLNSINRVLKPGGIFLLMDHDATETVFPIAWLAHFFFNAVTGEPREAELQEVRNFKPLDVWKSMISSKGLHSYSNPDGLIREGDPTKNTLLAFQKVPKSPEEFLVKKKNLEKYTLLHPAISHAYTAEYYNVLMAKGLAEFTQSGNHPWDYPHYFSDVASLIDADKKSRKITQEHLEFYHPLKGESHTAVDEMLTTSRFVTIFGSTEFLFKGILFSPFSFWKRSQVDQTTLSPLTSTNSPIVTN
jgi:SAM-dependent methyltransferase